MTRAVLAVMAGLLCALLGFRQAAALTGEARRLRRWGMLLRRLAVLLREDGPPLPEALRLCADGNTPADTLLRDLAQAMRDNPLETPHSLYLRLSAPCVERDALSRMTSALGHGTLEARVLAVEAAEEELRLLAEAAEDKAKRDAKLWQTLGLTGGACLTLLLW